MNDFILLLNWFSNPKRDDEFNFCLTKNSENPCIKLIVLLAHDKDRFADVVKKHPKCILVESSDRLTYRGFFSYANTYHPEENIIVSNLDVYFDESLRRCSEVDLNKCVLALSTTDRISTGSQDSWIFKTPLQGVGNMMCDFSLGCPGCDNRIAFEIKKAGYIPINKCLAIRSYHLHRDRTTTNYIQRIEGPHLLLSPEK